MRGDFWEWTQRHHARFSVMIIPCKLGVAVAILSALELVEMKLEEL